MKKKILSLVLATGLVLSLSACSGGIDGEEARTYVSDFFDTVETGDYAAAAAFLHPERPADLEAFFQGLESQEGLDFSNIVIDKYTGFSSSYYDSTVKGAAYSLDMDVLAGGRTLEVEIEIVKNDNGYGIYNLDVDF